MEVPCPSCTLLNPIAAAQCSVCESRMGPSPPRVARPQTRPSPSAAADDTSGWLCGSCGSRDNVDPAALACSQCLAKRARWDCPACTLQNPVARAACDACGARNPTRPPPPDASLPPIAPPQPSGRPSPAATRPPRAAGWLCDGCAAAQRVLPALQTGGGGGGGEHCRVCGTPPRPGPAALERLTSAGSAVSGPPDSPRLQTAAMESLREADETAAAQTWAHIVAMCKASRESFVDDSFPPAAASIGDLSFVTGRLREQMGSLGWARPQHIRTRDGFSSRWAVLREPRPADIQQGVLGNCWFLSAMAVVAERPELLRRIFLTRDYVAQGAYQIRLCVDGAWRVVIVDDYLPVWRDSSMLAFTEGRRNQLWVPLLEKALAKALGGYSALIAGRSNEGLAILTGANCVSIPLDPERVAQTSDLGEAETGGAGCSHWDVAWAQLLSSREAAFLMGCSCGASGTAAVAEEEFQAMGLISQHAYSLLDVQEVEGLRLVKLRNPWGGQYKWRGEWGEGSPLWTPALRARLVREKSAAELAGVFWMPYEAFCRYFDTVDVCRVRDERWSELRLTTFLPPHARPGFVQPLRLIITETAEVELTLYQEGHRHSQPKPFGTLDLGIVVLKEGRKEGTSGGLATSAKRTVAPFTSLQDILQPGSYIVVPLALNHWGMELRSEEFPRAVLAVHSSKPLVAEKFTAHGPLLAEAVAAQAVRWGRRTATGLQGVETYLLQRGPSPLPSSSSQSSRSEAVSGFAGAALVVANQMEREAVEVAVDVTESLNIVSTRPGLKYTDVIPPLHRQVVMVLTQLEGSSAYQLGHRIHLRTLPPPIFGLFGAPAAERHDPQLSAGVAHLHRPISLFE